MQSEIDSHASTIVDLTRSIDSVKQDYCDLAGEKESIEAQLQHRKTTNETSKISAELNQITERYATAQRRIHDLELQLKNITTEFEHQIKTLTTNVQTKSTTENDQLRRQISELKNAKNDNFGETENQLKKKFSAEREQWAKDKRRLDSKIRHLAKQIGKYCFPFLTKISIFDQNFHF